MRRLLLIEDEDVIRRALTRLLERNRHEVVAVADVDAAEAAAPETFDIVLADLRLPGRDGTAVIPLADPVPVVVMTSHASVRSAVEAMRAGASDYIAKPFDHDELLLVLERALSRNRLDTLNRALERDLARAEPARERVGLTALGALAESLLGDPDATAPLHLHGEPGSGREDVARELHARGPHADGPLLVLDADDTALDETIFGAARGGTLVIRHPERLRAHARDALAARLAPRGGDASGGTAPFHLVAIARGAIDDGAPGDALDALLGARQRAVPPLSERRGDVAPLARRAAAAFGRRHAGRPATLPERTLAALGARDWPGNVAALERAVERAVLETLPAPEARVPTAAGDAPPPFELPDAAFGAADAPPDGTLDLDAYFRYAVLRLQDELSETELAARLGISRKALWERRHRTGLARAANAPGKP